MARADVKKGVTEVVLTLSEEEAEVLARVLGHLLGGGCLRAATSSIYRALSLVGYCGDGFPFENDNAPTLREE